jgi:hypothetical protein
MTEHPDRILPLGVAEVELPQVLSLREEATTPPAEVPGPTPELEPTVTANGHTENDNGVASGRWHVEAGRKGGRRVHQLIEQGRLYEKEHGLKRGRQRLRQLLELGKMYEKEHGLRPDLPQPGRERLSRTEREDLLRTFLQCLVRIAKPSFRAKLEQLVDALTPDDTNPAA